MKTISPLPPSSQTPPPVDELGSSLPPKPSSRRSRRFVQALSIAILLCLAGGAMSYLIFHSNQPSAARSGGTTNNSATEKRYPVSIQLDEAYGPNVKEALDICRPSDNQTYAGIINIHGGGWIGGDKSGQDNLCKTLASYGFVVANIDYRLAPSSVWPAQIADTQLAVRYIRSQATALHLDSNHICSYGDSAGAHLALLLDELTTIHSSDVANLLTQYSPKTSCAVDQFGPTDLARLYNENPNVATANVAALIGGLTPSSNPSLYADASPVTHITKQTGPILIVQGSADTTVLPDQSTELKQDLDALQIPEQYIGYNGGHEYRSVSPAQMAAIREQIIAFLKQYDQ